ncbi:MAG: hypothetical protein HKN09_06880, partial [Saprospiraceae bacterium]|nr:hypothetical protein [Saprospiraceae bacterium]
MKSILFSLNSLAAVLLIFAYISPYVDPSITGFFSIFGLFYPIILFVNILFIFLWLIIKAEKALLSFLLIAIGYAPLIKYFGFNSETENCSGISVISYNIGKTRIDFSRKDADKYIEQFRKFLKTENPDIICLQEKTKWHLDIYNDLFSEYNVYPNNELGTSICSKYPIVNGGNIPFESIAHNASWADVNIGSDTMRFYSIHLSSNRITRTTEKMLDNPDLSNTAIWGDLKFIFSRYNKHAQLRSLQLDTLLMHASKSPHPVVISGDFNDVPQSYIYNQICARYNDAFTERGFELAKTFISVVPGLR